MGRPLRTALLVAACAIAALPQSPAQSPAAQAALAAQINTLLASPAVSRAHWGIEVASPDGTPIYALNEAQYFQPASNAKLFTTAAALALLGPNTTFDTRVLAEGHIANGILHGNLVLRGDGDANLSARPIPYTPAHTPNPTPPLHILDELADQIAATGLKEITGDLLGDDTLFPFEPYAPDWAIDDTPWGYGAPVNALTINDNQLKLTVSPTVPQSPAAVTLNPASPYYTVDNEVLTTPVKTRTWIGIDRSSINPSGIDHAPGSKTLRLFGTIAADAPPDAEEIAIDDPATYAALSLKIALEARGILVHGAAQARHRTPTAQSNFQEQVTKPLALTASPTPPIYGTALATHRSPTLAEDVTVTNKVSQNLHAELLLHHLAVTFGDPSTPLTDNGSTPQGVRVVRQFLLNAGLDKDDFVFFDGSGLSGHDLVTPRSIIQLLAFASNQPWFPIYKASLPLAGVDGSLETRFAKSPVKGLLSAKTGTLGEARALSGYLQCASGRTVLLTILVSPHSPANAADRATMDKIVEAIAAAE
jgi:D-alanyl-D-alanine carboxypeptidase/D-alanyl-D-alanine-endopeptidase (penicillin-binding protein 4)